MNERERLEKIMSAEGMNAKQFAMQVGIQPGTMSNIMNGRNNPSLDVLQRVLNSFRAISADWLILGSGPMYRQKFDSNQPTLFDVADSESTANKEEMVVSAPIHSVPASSTPQSSTEYKANARAKADALNASKSAEKRVLKVVLFFEDGTYQEF